MTIDFSCEKCGKAFRVDDKYAGKKAKCRGCATVMEIPQPALPEAILIDENILDEALSNDNADGIVVTCSCGHRLTMPYEQAGVRINCPACMAELLVRDEEEVWTKESSLLDNDTAASKPGAFRPQFFRYAMHFPLNPALSVCSIIAAVILWMIGIEMAMVIAVIIGAAFWMFYSWKLIREQCYFGCLNPGVVLDTGSFGLVRLAVFTDLSKGEGNYPAIKVFWQRVTLPDGSRPTAGMRLSTVAIYRGADNGTPHWMDFSPKAVVSLTSDKAVIQMTTSQFNEAEWRELDMGVASLEQPPGGGLHFLQAQ